MTEPQTSAFDSLVADAVDRTADLAAEICRIAAPTGDEMQRARFVQQQMASRGLQPQIDDIANVVARRLGGDGPTLMLAAHTDTVFPAETELTVSQTQDTLAGPGIGDNCVAVAAMLTLIELLDAANITTPGDVLFAATVGEEGLGNLRGIRQMVTQYESELGAVIALEGHGLGRVVNTAVGSKRIRAHVTCAGGHSWHAFGQPSAIHHLSTIIHRIAQIQTPTEPKVTYNVGLIEGGDSINTIAPSASAAIDMRSTDPEALTALTNEIEQIIESQQGEGVDTRIEVLGERPAGSVPEDTPIVQATFDVLTSLGVKAHLHASSTDANIPIARNIPAVCVGITTGSAMHTVNEQISISPIKSGLLQLMHLVERFPVGEAEHPSSMVERS